MTGNISSSWGSWSLKDVDQTGASPDFFLNFSKNGAICNQENYTNSGNYWKQGFEGLRDGAIVAHVRCSADLHLTDVQHARDVKALS